MKKLTKFELAAVKRTAKNVASLVSKNEKLLEKMSILQEELNANDELINLWETPIKALHGYTSTEILSKINEDNEIIEGDDEFRDGESSQPNLSTTDNDTFSIELGEEEPKEEVFQGFQQTI